MPHEAWTSLGCWVDSCWYGTLLIEQHLRNCNLSDVRESLLQSESKCWETAGMHEWSSHQTLTKNARNIRPGTDEILSSQAYFYRWLWISWSRKVVLINIHKPMHKSITINKLKQLTLKTNYKKASNCLRLTANACSQKCLKVKIFRVVQTFIAVVQQYPKAPQVFGLHQGNRGIGVFLPLCESCDG